MKTTLFHIQSKLTKLYPKDLMTTALLLLFFCESKLDIAQPIDQLGVYLDRNLLNCTKNIIILSNFVQLE